VEAQHTLHPEELRAGQFAGFQRSARWEVPLRSGTQRIEIQWIQGIGGERAPAPQARLMATVINGILTQRLPWRLVLLACSW